MGVAMLAAARMEHSHACTFLARISGLRPCANAPVTMATRVDRSALLLRACVCDRRSCRPPGPLIPLRASFRPTPPTSFLVADDGRRTPSLPPPLADSGRDPGLLPRGPPDPGRLRLPPEPGRLP